MPFLTSSEIVEREPFPGYKGRFIHGLQMTIADWTIAEGARFPEHSHPHEQIVHVLDGTFELTVGTETRVLQPGTAAVIPPGTRHGGRALSACRLIDVFHPVREDYR